MPQALLPNAPGSIMAGRLSAWKVIAFFCLFVIARALGQVPSPPPADTGACAELKSGIVVERVAKNSEGEKAGLAEGDVILAWSRGDADGEIRSPFDLSEVETEQEPRGPVTLIVEHGGAKGTWTLGPGRWGVLTRPNFVEPVLAIYGEGQELAKASKVTEAAESWQRAAATTHKLPCPWLSAWLFFRAANLLSDTEQKKADDLYKDAVQQAMKAQVGSEVIVPLLVAWAAESQAHGDLISAEKHQQQALEEIRGSGFEKLAAANILRSLGKGTFERGDMAGTENYFEQALSIQEKLAPGSLDAAKSLYSLGNLATDRRDLAKAEEYHRQALAIREKLAPGSLDLSSSLNNLSKVLLLRDNTAQAEKYDRQALAIREKLAPGSLDLAFTLNHLGIEAQDRGDMAKAEEYYRQSLTIREHLAPGSLQVAQSLRNIGNLAKWREDPRMAEQYFRQALAIQEKQAPGSLETAAILEELVNAAYRSGDVARAEDYSRRALAINENLAPGSLDLAYCLIILGSGALDRGDVAKAEDYSKRALTITQKLAPRSHFASRALENLGEIAEDRGDLVKAEQYYRQALQATTELAPESNGYRLAELAGTVRKLERPDEAAKLYAEALDVFDRLSTTLGGSTDTRAGFREQHAKYYSDYVDLLIAQKKSELAFQVMERARARTLLEILAESHIEIRQGVEPAVIEKERLLQAALTAKTNRKITLLEGEHTDEQLTTIKKEIDEILADYEELKGQIRLSSPKYASLTQPKPLGADEVQQQLLDADTMLLEYVLGTERSFVFAVTPTSLESFELPKRAEIEATARHIYDLLTSRNRWVDGETSVQRKSRLSKDETEYDKATAALSQIVLGPIAKRLERKRLLIVADGTLQYIPFSVLPIPTDDAWRRSIPLVAEHEIINLPSASVLALLRQQVKNHETQPSKEVAILADPVFDRSDPRVGRPKEVTLAAEKNVASELAVARAEHLTRSLQDVKGTRNPVAGLPRLVFSRREAAAIAAVSKPREGMEALDFQASRETAMSKELSQYRIVHFATHGLLDNEHPELSGLVLSMVGPDGGSRNGFLDLEDIYNLSLPADLVVLSACETGLGKEISGEGLVGLTRGFMYAGASRVVASLWQVDDAATAELMGTFYKAMLVDGLRPAAALRQAQIELMKQKRWHDPYYWAAFTLQGEWK